MSAGVRAAFIAPGAAWLAVPSGRPTDEELDLEMLDRRRVEQC